MVYWDLSDKELKWYLTNRKNQLLQDLTQTLGDVEMVKVARELKQVLQELNTLSMEKEE